MTPHIRALFRGAALVAVLVGVAACGSPQSSVGQHHEGDEIPNVGPDELAVAVPGFDLAVGEPQRFVVGLFTAGRTDIGYGIVSLRFRWVGDGTNVEDGEFGEPITAEFRLLPGTASGPAPQAPTVLAPDQGRGVYVAEASFDRAGFWQVVVAGDVAGTDADAGVGAFDVLEDHAVPAVGDAAIASENATMTTPETSAAALDSRADTLAEIPDPALHQLSISDALSDHRPAVLVFSTPTYCLSRFCGPVTDMVTTLADRYHDRAEFIHIEIWQDFDNQTLSSTAQDWLLRDGNLQEPWVFLVGSDGRILARWDNVLISDELEAALERLPQGGG